MGALKPRIVSIGKGDLVYENEIVLNLGSKSGVIKHMLFYFKRGDNQLILGIKDVKETTSIATVHGISGTGENFEPKVGMRFSSKLPARFMEF